ncbi:MAG: hypothetical protein MUC59_11275 [Saprospiraceae bacterium]|nr:hypothetical protein [Saprospiraceae bacterium]
METDVLKSRFSNVQLELLQLFTEDVPSDELLVIKDILTSYRFRRATEAANKVAAEKGWTAEDYEKMLHSHQRTPYPASNK